MINSQTKARFNFWDGSRVNSSDHLIHSDGIYSLESYDHPYCKLNQSILVDEKCPLRVFIPNAFTPGGFTNPTFFPVVSNHTKLDFYIYNRWGQLVFKSHSPNDVWDGTFNGKPAQQDIYIWKIFVYITYYKRSH